MSARARMVARLKTYGTEQLITAVEHLRKRCKANPTDRALRIAHLAAASELHKRGFFYCYVCRSWGRHEDGDCK